MGETHFAQCKVGVYEFVLLICAVSFSVVQIVSLKNENPDSADEKVMKNTTNETISTIFYSIGIAVSFFFPIISLVLYFMVAMIWLITDKRVKKRID